MEAEETSKSVHSVSERYDCDVSRGSAAITAASALDDDDEADDDAFDLVQLGRAKRFFWRVLEIMLPLLRSTLGGEIATVLSAERSKAGFSERDGKLLHGMRG